MVISEFDSFNVNLLYLFTFYKQFLQIWKTNAQVSKATPHHQVAQSNPPQNRGVALSHEIIRGSVGGVMASGVRRLAIEQSRRFPGPIDGKGPTQFFKGFFKFLWWLNRFVSRGGCLSVALSRCICRGAMRPYKFRACALRPYMKSQFFVIKFITLTGLWFKPPPELKIVLKSYGFMFLVGF